MKKTLAVVLCAVFLLTGCGAASSGSSSSDSKKLVLSTFGLSEDISEEQVYQPFEKEYNCNIVTDTGTAAERYTKISSDSESTIDVIELSQAMTAQGIADGLFEDIDLSKIENSDDMIDVAKELAQSGNGVAYTINSMGIIYDKDAVGFEINSFNDLWNAALAGKIAIPDITTTFGPAMVYLASDYKGVDIKSDNGDAAFEALAELKPNIVKTYSKSSDLVNMFTSGEVAAAVVGDFAVPVITKSNPDLVYVTPEGTYANFNIMSINKNSQNKDLAYQYINYRLSKDLQTTTGKALNEAPTNKTVTFTAEEAQNMTYGDVATKAKSLDYSFVNPILSNWIDQWNRILNN